MKRLKFIVILISLISILAMPFNVMAATETLTVDAEGTYTSGTYVGGAGTFVNLQSNDDDTSYLNVVGTITVPLRHTYSFTNSAVTSIESLTLYYRVRYMSAGDSHIKTYATVGGVDYLNTLEAITDTAYVLYAVTWPLNPATGEVWTLATINASTFGLEFLGTYRWTYAYMSVNYTPSSYPTVVSQNPTLIGLTSATFNAEVTDYGASNIDERGFVWDIASHNNPGDVNHAATAYANNWAQAGDWTIGTFSYAAAVLVADTTYYYRAFVHNASGFVYGNEITFRTIGTPVVTLLAASNVARVTAQLNASLLYDGNQPCDVQFGYDTVTHAGNFAAYAVHTPLIINTYTSEDNNTPYVEITGLIVGTPYFFNVAVTNDFITVYGVELTFTTSAIALLPPDNLYAKPEMSALNLSWTKDTNATGTLIRYSLATYPAAVTDGATAYEGVGTSYRLTGVPSGRTVYLTAWSYSNGTFSVTNTQILTTTLAANVNDSIGSLPTPAEIAKWMVDPTNANLQKLPGHQLVTNWAVSYQMPEVTAWFIVGILFSVAIAGFAWGIDSNHSPMAAMTGLCIGLGGGIAAGIYSGWMLAIVVIIALASLVIAWRA